MSDGPTEYDVLVLGAGPAGENAADRARAAGLTAAVIERELVGGECSYWACIPSKALLRPGSLREETAHVPGLAPAALDPAAALARRNAMVGDWRDGGQVDWLASAGIDLVRGHGRLAGERRVLVEREGEPPLELTARQAVVVATGSRALVPDLPGAAEARLWTSREATAAQQVPARLAVIGGGVVGVEMAAAWQSLGARVTLLVRGERPLPRMEPFAGDLVADGLRAVGVDVRTGTSATALHRDGDTVTLTLDDGTTVEAEEVLAATGRAPRTDDLGLDTVGLRPGAVLPVDDTLRVDGSDWLYAIGDANGRAPLTHQGKYQARIAGAAIAARARGARLDDGPWGAHAATADTEARPQVVFTRPEVAAVGLTAAQAEARGLQFRTADHDLAAVAGASLHTDDYRGRARLVIDTAHDTLLGATFTGPGTAELLHSATIAVAARVPLARLWHAVPSFPTLSEIWLRLLETDRDRG